MWCQRNTRGYKDVHIRVRYTFFRNLFEYLHRKKFHKEKNCYQKENLENKLFLISLLTFCNPTPPAPPKNQKIVSKVLTSLYVGFHIILEGWYGIQCPPA